MVHNVKTMLVVENAKKQSNKKKQKQRQNTHVQNHYKQLKTQRTKPGATSKIFNLRLFISRIVIVLFAVIVVKLVKHLSNCDFVLASLKSV